MSEVERGRKDISSDRLARAVTALRVEPAQFFADVSRSLGGDEPAVAAGRAPTRLTQSVRRLSPDAQRAVAEFSAYLVTKEAAPRRRRIGFEL
jgi:hypothetical protein